MVTVIGVRFKDVGKTYSFDPAGLEIAREDAVIVETARGIEFGTCVQPPHEVEDDAIVPPLRRTVRLATPEDFKTLRANEEKEKKAAEVCREKIIAHKLDMKFVSAEYAFDGSKIIFYFTADGRVDFRELVKDLAGVFRTRIELRQIGVRDEAKMLGGLGICGKPFCCATFLDEFQPVSIKMAKEQNLSLNPTKISGTCGRLMCCLKFEQEAYEDLLKTTPRVDSTVKTPDGVGIVEEVSLLRGRLKVRLDDAPEALKVYDKCDCCPMKGARRAAEGRPPSKADAVPEAKPKTGNGNGNQSGGHPPRQSKPGGAPKPGNHPPRPKQKPEPEKKHESV